MISCVNGIVARSIAVCYLSHSTFAFSEFSICVFFLCTIWPMRVKNFFRFYRCPNRVIRNARKYLTLARERYSSLHWHSSHTPSIPIRSSKFNSNSRWIKRERERMKNETLQMRWENSRSAQCRSWTIRGGNKFRESSSVRHGFFFACNRKHIGRVVARWSLPFLLSSSSIGSSCSRISDAIQTCIISVMLLPFTQSLLKQWTVKLPTGLLFLLLTHCTHYVHQQNA